MYAHTASPASAADHDRHWADIPANRQHTINLAHNETLFYEGDDIEFLYEVLEGLLITYSILPDGRRQIVNLSHPGELVGLSVDEEHHYSCCAKGPTKVRSIPRRMLTRIAREQPEIAARLLTSTTRQLNRVQDHFVLLGRKSAQERVAMFLLTLALRYADCGADSVTFTLPVTRSDIADYLGTTIETVSRQMSKLRIARVIDLPQPWTVHVRSIRGLEQLAEPDDDIL